MDNQPSANAPDAPSLFPDQARNAQFGGSGNGPASTFEPGTGPTEGAESRQEAPQSLVGQAKQQVASALSDRKDGIADRIEAVADTVHRSGEQFAGKQDWIAGAIERGASELTALATSLREADVATLARQVQSFARRQPATFVGASFAIGFALARFGKIVAADVTRDDLPTIPEVAHVQS